MTNSSSVKKILQMKIVSALLLLFILGCSDGSNSESYKSDSSMSGTEINSEEGMRQQLVPSGSAAEQEQKIIKNARLAFETKSVDGTHKKILQLASQYKG